MCKWLQLHGEAWRGLPFFFFFLPPLTWYECPLHRSLMNQAFTLLLAPLNNTNRVNGCNCHFSTANLNEQRQQKEKHNHRGCLTMSRSYYKVNAERSRAMVNFMTWHALMERFTHSRISHVHLRKSPWKIFRKGRCLSNKTWNMIGPIRFLHHQTLVEKVL